MEEQSSVNYLFMSKQDIEWGIAVSTVGYQRIASNASYPPNINHADYYFSTEKGRVLKEYQIIYIINGQGTFQSSSCPPVNVKGGQMILLFPGEWHSYCPDKLVGWVEHWIGFCGCTMDTLVEKGFFTPSQPIFNIGFNDKIIDLYYQAASIAQKEEPGFQQQLAGIVQMLLGYTFSKSHVVPDNDVSLCIIRAKEFVQQHYADDISPDDMATRVGMSMTQFRLKFKEHTGMTPNNYIMEVRISKSKELLVNTKMTSKEIAYSVGFNTPYYFSICFRHSVGMSPTDYRKISGHQ